MSLHVFNALQVTDRFEIVYRPPKGLPQPFGISHLALRLAGHVVVVVTTATVVAAVVSTIVVVTVDVVVVEVVVSVVVVREVVVIKFGSVHTLPVQNM